MSEAETGREPKVTGLQPQGLALVVPRRVGRWFPLPPRGGRWVHLGHRAPRPQRLQDGSRSAEDGRCETLHHLLWVPAEVTGVELFPPGVSSVVASQIMPMAKICVLTSPWGDKLQESLSLGDGSHPFLEDLLEDIREILAPGAGRPAEGQPFFLDILHSRAMNPDHQFPRDHGPTPSLAGHLAKRGGAGVLGGNYPSADHFSELIRSTFLEEVPKGMVDGPLTKVEAAARCGCNP